MDIVPPTNPRWAEVKEAFFRGQAQAKARRSRVLEHPDLAAELTQRPLSFPTAEMWNGHVPPAWIPTRDGWKRNQAPERRALIAICKAVAERDEQQDGDAA